MRKLIFILLAFISVATYGQTKQTIKQLTVNDSLTIKAGNPAPNKIAVSVDGNGRFRWQYFSVFQDSINTGVYDTLNVNLLNANTVRVNRDSFTDPAATIASIGDSGFVVECFTCDTIQYLLNNVGGYSPWDSLAGNVFLKDTTDKVGIGTSSPTANLHVNGDIQQVYYYDTLGNIIGANPWFSALLPFQPSSVFRFNDTLVQGNDLRNTLFDMSSSTGSIINNQANYQTSFSLSGSGNVNVNNLFGVDVTGNNFVGEFSSNDFSNAYTVDISNASGLISNNSGSGASYHMDLTGTSGNVLGNQFNGLVDFINSTGDLLGNIIEHGAELFGDGVFGNVNANYFQTGSKLQCSLADSSISKNTFKYTVLVDADSSEDKIEYSDFIGSFDSYQPYIYARRNLGYIIGGSTFYVVDSLILDPNYDYRNLFWMDRKLGVKVPDAKITADFHVDGTVRLDGINAKTGYVLTAIDTNGNATWQDHTAYGEMGFGDSTRTIALTQNVFSVVTNSNNTLWQTAAIDLHNVTYSGDSLIIDSAGVYQVNIQLSMDGTSGSVIRLGVFLNGVLACSCTGYQELLNNRILQLTYINIDALNAGDVLQVVITNTANGDDVDAIGGKITVNKIR